MANKKYWIGEVAKETCLSLRTIRYYEELGLLRPKSRTAGHFRLYSESEMVRLRSIQTLKDLGYPLKDIQEAEENDTVDDLGKDVNISIPTQREIDAFWF